MSTLAAALTLAIELAATAVHKLLELIADRVRPR